MTMGSADSPLNLVRGAATKAEWAQLIRLGGDRVAILFDELRMSVGGIDGLVQRLHYSDVEERWVVRYEVGDAELFTVRISPGVLEASLTLSWPEVESLLQNRTVSKNVRDVIQNGAREAGSSSARFLLRDRRTVRSFANLARARKSLISNTHRGVARIGPSSAKALEDR
jgi:hypothetical protein